MKIYLEKMKATIPTFVLNKLVTLCKNEEELIGVLEDFIERAGIMEYAGNQTRFSAEKRALECVINNLRRKND